MGQVRSVTRLSPAGLSFIALSLSYAVKFTNDSMMCFMSHYHMTTVTVVLTDCKDSARDARKHVCMCSEHMAASDSMQRGMRCQSCSA